MIVTAQAFPYGVQCQNCGRKIMTGEPYKNRDAVTGKLSTGPCDEDRTDGGVLPELLG